MEIIGLYAKNLMALYSINQISKALDKKYPYINKKVTALIQAGIFRKIEIGRSYLCSLNLQNPRTVILLSLYHISKIDEQKLLGEEMGKKFKDLRNDFIVESVVFFANRYYFLLNDNSQISAISSRLHKIDSQRFEALTLKEFSEMLLANKPLYENHAVIYGYERFYEAIEKIEDKLKMAYSPLFKNG